MRKVVRGGEARMSVCQEGCEQGYERGDERGGGVNYH